MSSVQTLHGLVQQVTDFIGDQPLDAALQAKLNKQFPFGGPLYNRILEQCQQGIKDGSMCKHESGGIRFGRVIKPDAALRGYSVDVVDMQDIAGPHHRHPEGEIDLIMPLSEGAQFDGHPGGWLVYGPETAHSPTVSQGQALVLYLLPNGKIEFTKN